MSERPDVEGFQVANSSANNGSPRPCTQPIVHRQPSFDTSSAMNATNINTAAQFFMNPAFQAHINSLQNTNSINVDRELDNGLRQVFLGISTLFRALAAAPGDGEHHQQGQDPSSYGITYITGDP